ncbi:hypothetical protein FACS1894200_14570 [Spirochaetia bacterium]|nr:hypothetical protein FACS1894200_14570 [Spirochaetia bacterium]
MPGMITIQQTVDVPASRQLVLEVLHEVPEGRTSVVLVFSEAKEKPDNPAETLDAHIFAPFPTLEELKAEAARKAAEQQAYFEATGKDPLQKYCGTLKDVFDEDGVVIQRRMRDEWPGAAYRLTADKSGLLPSGQSANNSNY